MKTVFRIKDKQAEILHDAAVQLAAAGIDMSESNMVQRGVELFIKQEIPVHLAAIRAAKNARKQLGQKDRQPVGEERVAS